MSQSAKVAPGQRWVSDMEPELGLGVLVAAQYGKMEMYFPAAGISRTYAIESAPLRRARVRVGRRLLTHEGDELEVDRVEEQEGILVYHCGDRVISEDDLSDTMSFSQPEERLLAGRVDSLRDFQLRVESLYRSRKVLQSPVRGLIGARIDLIPHQQAIVREVASRLAPRVLLADEVGLGKTIEACLIMHRLHLTGRADRVLIVVPDALVHQWFVELLRRFNLLFALFDEDRCQSIVAGDPEANPFHDSQLVLCSLNFLLQNPERVPQVVEAGWDMLIIDEAHHLEWSRDKAGESYELAQALAEETPAVLLLTATPQQLGRDGHFARLQLLDPDRFTDLDAYYEETERYEEVAVLVDALSDGGTPPLKEFEKSGKLARRIVNRAEALLGGDESERELLIRDLLDSFGTGRLLFRNTRDHLTGFPERRVSIESLESDEEELIAKTEWLIDFLRGSPEKKVLLICRTKERVNEIGELLRDRVNLKFSGFHEDLTLLQRDRNAAYFSEEDGARLLLCSEIGSEGRNFQFVQDLVLFDLPQEPELLEQRIGRLDRIGQTGTIQIHVPVMADTGEARVARWYHEGLNAFEHSLAGAAVILERLGDYESLMSKKDIDKLIVETVTLRKEVAQQLESGHDRLLALASREAGDPSETIDAIRVWDEDTVFEGWFTRLLDHFGLKVEGLGNRSYLLHPGNVEMNSFPNLPEEGLGVTLDRERALSREELGFLSADHPIVRSSIEMMLSSDSGNSSFAVWAAAGERTIILECYYVVECIAPASYHVERFLPPSPLRVACDHTGKDWSGDKALLKAKLRPGPYTKLLSQPKVSQEILPKMLLQLEEMASTQKQSVIETAKKNAEKEFSRELSRLKTLADLNDLVRDDEIDHLQKRAQEVQGFIDSARVRLDTVRMVWKSP